MNEGKWGESEIKEYEDIREMRLLDIIHTDQYCHKLRIGEVP